MGVQKLKEKELKEEASPQKPNQGKESQRPRIHPKPPHLKQKSKQKTEQKKEQEKVTKQGIVTKLIKEFSGRNLNLTGSMLPQQAQKPARAKSAGAKGKWRPKKGSLRKGREIRKTSPL